MFNNVRNSIEAFFGVRAQMDGCPIGYRNLDWIVDPVQVQRLCLMIDHIAAYMTKMS